MEASEVCGPSRVSSPRPLNRSDSLSRDGRVTVVNRQVQPEALTLFTE